MLENKEIIAEVISVFPDKIKISVNNIQEFASKNNIKVGSYLRVSDHDECSLITIVQSFCISVDNNSQRSYIIESLPLGIIRDNQFIRGGDELTIPPTGVEPASDEDIKRIFENSVDIDKKFTFSVLGNNPAIKTAVDGNKFFNKHIAIIGSTGSGKSHTIAKIIQKAVSAKDGQFTLNNSHIVIFDIHSEYQTAFPNTNVLDVSKLRLPYWLLNSEELEEILLDTGERDNYNQSSVFRTLVTENKKRHNPEMTSVYYDSPLKFDIREVLNALYNIKSETINAKKESSYMIIDSSIDATLGIELNDSERLERYFKERLKFHATKPASIKKGDYADGTLNKFFTRFESKVAQERLNFLFSRESENETLESVLKTLVGYTEHKSNVSIIDLSGVPFEVLNITVSLISRILFEYGYYYKLLRNAADEEINNDAPLLLVFEEAHKYVPNNELTKFRASKLSIERIAKEGRKYGVTLLLSSQRPSEISETIFSQCNNFIVMRLTNPSDQNYVARFLPDTLGNLINKLPTLEAGEALWIGEAVVMPSLVKIERCDLPPSSKDIPYFKLWKEEWKDIDFAEIRKSWLNQ